MIETFGIPNLGETTSLSYLAASRVASPLKTTPQLLPVFTASCALLTSFALEEIALATTSWASLEADKI
jgi:hypothetical protein